MKTPPSGAEMIDRVEQATKKKSPNKLVKSSFKRNRYEYLTQSTVTESALFYFYTFY